MLVACKLIVNKQAKHIRHEKFTQQLHSFNVNYEQPFKFINLL